MGFWFAFWLHNAPLESPLACKETKPVHPKGNQPWIFIGRTDGEAEAPVLWPPDAKSQLIGKDPDAGKDWRQEEKGTTENEMVGWHQRLNGHEFEQAQGDGDGLGRCATVHGLQRVRHNWATEQQAPVCPWDNISIPQHVRKTCRDLARIPLQPWACLSPLCVTHFSPAGLYSGP